MFPGRSSPRRCPTGAAYDQLIERVRSNEIMRGKLLSEDGTLALVVLAHRAGDRQRRRAQRRSSARSATRSPSTSKAPG